MHKCCMGVLCFPEGPRVPAHAGTRGPCALQGRRKLNDLITRDEVMDRLRCGRSKIYVLMDNDGFPRPIKIGRDNRWIASEVDAWLERQAAKRETGELSSVA